MEGIDKTVCIIIALCVIPWALVGMIDSANQSNLKIECYRAAAELAKIAQSKNLEIEKFTIKCDK
jgi:hypothetical protein